MPSRVYVARPRAGEVRAKTLQTAGPWQDIVLEVAAMFGLAEGLVLEFDAIGSYIFLFVVLT